MLFLLSLSFAGDTGLYQRALDVLNTHYLWEERLIPGAMWEGAGKALENRVEWLLVDTSPTTLHLHDGSNRWSADIELKDGSQLPAALSQLEDAVAQGAAAVGLPLDPKLKLSVEILKGLVKPLDRHTVVLAGDGLERFDERISGTLTGIGSSIGPDAQGQLVVKRLFAGAPAEKGGLQVGDKVLRINGISTMGMSSSDATRYIRGEAGTEVTLTVLRGAEELTLTFVRAELTIPNVTSAPGPDGVGVVTIDHFSEQTTLYLQNSLLELGEQGLLASGLIVDLRGNTGGSLLQSAQAADTFVSSGLIVRTAGRSGAPVSGLVGRIEARSEPPPYAMPLLVMMDRSTASGSEIMAGSLAQLGRALLVGTPSFGKGTVQKTYTIGPDIKLKLTVAEYLLDRDLRVADVGLVPDVELDTVRFSEDGIWYADPARTRARLPPGTPVIPVVAEAGKEDNSLTMAARLLRAATGGDRLAMLDATNSILARLRAEADAALVQAFALHQIDWTPGTAPSNPAIELKLQGSDWLATGRPGSLVWSVKNPGPSLYRAAIRLHSLNQTYDDRLIPLGFLENGTEAEVRLNLTPDPGPSRRDPVEFWLELPDQPARLLQTTTLGVVSPPPPELTVTAVYQPCPAAGCAPGQRSQVQLTIVNAGKEAVSGFTAHFDFPDQGGIELLEELSPPQDLAPKSTSTITLGLRTTSAFTGDTLPLELELEAKELGRFARWKLPLPVAGAPLVLAAPRLSLHGLPGSAKAGRRHLSVVATDDHSIHHLVVFAGSETMEHNHGIPSLHYEGDKIAWQPGRGRNEKLTVDVPVLVGTNRYTVIAEDDQGLRTSSVVVVIGK